MTDFFHKVKHGGSDCFPVGFKKNNYLHKILYGQVGNADCVDGEGGKYLRLCSDGGQNRQVVQPLAWGQQIDSQKEQILETG